MNPKNFFPVPPKDLHPAIIANSSINSYHSSNPGSLNAAFIPQPLPFREEINILTSKLKCLEKGGFLAELQSKYNCKIEVRPSKAIITTPHQNIQEVISEIEQKLNSLPFEGDAVWEYLDNSGQYLKYDEGVCQLIENAYKASYLIICHENYEDYQESATFEYNYVPYNCFFGKPGRPHIQMRIVSGNTRNVNLNELLSQKDINEYKFDHLTIRAVRRTVQGEERKEDQRLNYCWYWKDDDKKFKPYTYEANYIIEHGYRNYLRNPDAYQFIIIQGTNIYAYQIIFSQMCQYNENTRYRREIKREDINYH